MKYTNLKTDFCVVGGGMAGICAAIAAARKGIQVVLIQDRPVLGGNASSEIRMHICGANGKDTRETGIIEELLLENYYRNPSANYSIWDSILYEKVKFQDNLTLLLNCTCNDIVMEGNVIKKIKAWQLTTETWYEIDAKLFADCSGDGILAPLSGAEYRIGREARDEFDESIEPINSDRRTMGMSCLLQARETDTYQRFIKPEWANTYKTDEELRRSHDLLSCNYWWIELGGEQDSIHDTEDIRDELLKIAFGVWDHIKNQGDHGADNWRLEWIGFLPGKRESRRYIGRHILTQNDIEAEGKFDDIIGHGGWSMDDHFIEGFNYPKEGTIFHPAPSPYGIPYRCLYSNNIENLYFAGRNISATHAAMSSTRVMATCAVMGQGVGTAAAIAAKNNMTPNDVYECKIKDLQRELLQDDVYLPWKKNTYSDITTGSKIVSKQGDTDNLRNGIERCLEGKENCWIADLNTSLIYEFNDTKHINGFKIVFDSDLNRWCKNMPYVYPIKTKYLQVPSTIVKDLKVEFMNELGKWEELIYLENNHQRIVKLDVCVESRALRFTPHNTWGASEARIFAIDIY